jgi:hypothetical protein
MVCTGRLLAQEASSEDMTAVAATASDDRGIAAITRLAP